MVGRTVKRGTQTATIRLVLSDIPGGVFLDTPIEGLRYWNIQELTFLD